MTPRELVQKILDTGSHPESCATAKRRDGSRLTIWGEVTSEVWEEAMQLIQRPAPTGITPEMRARNRLLAAVARRET